MDVAYPFLLELYHDYANGTLSAADFAAAVRLVEAYVFRRAICAIPTNSMNKTFATFGKALKKDRYLESIQAHFLTLPSYRRFPADDEFRRDLHTRDLYNFRSRSYWLRRLENHGRKERVPVDEYTIEHILPQNPDLPAAWQQALGRSGSACSSSGCTPSATSRSPATTPSTATGPSPRSATWRAASRRARSGSTPGSASSTRGTRPPSRSAPGGSPIRRSRCGPRPSSMPQRLAAYQPEKAPAAGGYTIEDHPHLLTAWPCARCSRRSARRCSRSIPA